MSEYSMMRASAEGGLPVVETTDVRRALRRLRLKDRRLLWMVYVEGRKSAEIAADAGVSVTAARQRVARATSRLRAALGQPYQREAE